MKTKEAVDKLVAAGLVTTTTKEAIIGGTSVEDTGNHIFSYSRLFKIFLTEEKKWKAVCVMLGQTPTETECDSLSAAVEKVIEAYRRFGLLSEETAAA